MKVFRNIALTLLIAIGCLAFTSSPARAFNIYNYSSVSVQAKVPDGDFVQKIPPGENRACNWSNKGCNPSGGREAMLQVWIETDRDFLCILPLQAGGYATIEEVRNSGANRNDLKCKTHYFGHSRYPDHTLTANTPYAAGGLYPRNIHFLATADPQYDNGNKPKKEVADKVLQEMKSRLKSTNDIRGIIVAGDLTQNARTMDEFKWYQQSIEGQARFVFDGLGNHDLESTGITSNPAGVIKDIKERKRGTRLSGWLNEHYSWDWDDVHFVQLNLFPGNQPAPQFPKLNPNNSLSFLADDLRTKVGSSGRPVVLISHYGFDGFSTATSGEVWWTEQQRKDFWEKIAPYNVVAIFSGHLHPTPGGSWDYPFYRPSGTSNGPSKIPAFVAGATREGAFIDVQITSDKLIIQRMGIQPGETTAKLYDRKEIPLSSS
ncbi:MULTISPECIES: metallophosphoesterase [unclassified Microcoleus]|uniref:metallophosphoesterase n=1 Tax=unclassified Microcoleus TaxID=2642155 RepID=UPI001D29EB2D|nr:MULTISPECIES: metallophosphoesterase [unclassified Microcoleus]MCC3475853.1 metallophosphoesterase [Microcoleus sp. PH2017_13_LAR_U_A]MCC3488375.1 metallophosphoesterase [Microcoleus sp. PH2017_14_LAR_D_A]MCC3593482.1 metallophosphoesterase [Microcoleus sp. PH2017_28_MFU_U_A]MCC3600943.1 metallophosphoesterase [Microcoleus sp. PH2017_26_ELK_O_A]MCC3626120.1 metallophosphoesterase [Microcoleus sp. PH2017_36_ELK_O_B]